MTLPANVTRFLFEIPSMQMPAGQELRVIGFQYHAEVASIFSCSVEIASENNAIDLQGLIGKSARLTLFDERNPQYIHGEVVQAQQGEQGNRYTLYTLQLAPKLAFYQYRKDQRIFQDQSAPDIIKKVLQQGGLEDDQVEWNLTGSYSNRVYCTQYGETDLNFINRLMEEEGIYYFFEHQHDRHLMVISDSKNRFRNIDGESVVRYKERTGMVSSEESIYEFGASVSVHSGKVTLRDYSFEKSNLRLEHSDQQAEHTDLEQYHYQNNYTEPSQGKHLAKVRLQALSALAECAKGKSDSLRLDVGKRFTIKDHPNRGFNSEYTLLSVAVEGKQPQSLGEGASTEGSQFSVAFRAIPSSVEYKTALETHQPKIEGTQTAIVTGPSGEEIYTDQHGRIKVQFHWDREGAYNESSSCWLRVCQTIAGNQWGSMVLPRVGQEVLVAFINGNPDRPLVKGALYNGSNQTPYSLPQDKTKTLFKSHSSPGGGGFNELQLEDKKGEERVYVRAEKDVDLFIQNEWKEWVGKEQHLTVGNSRHIEVGKELNTSVKSNHNVKTGDSYSEKSGQNTQIKINGSHTEQASQDISLKAGMTLVLQAGVELTLKAGGGLVKLDPSGVTIKGPMVKINTGGAAQAGKAASPTAPAAPKSPDKGDGPGRVNKPASANGYEAKPAQAEKEQVSTFQPDSKPVSKAQIQGRP